MSISMGAFVFSLDSAFAWLVAHALAAAGLALAVAGLARGVRHAAVVHALWVVVLLKLLTPPFVELAVLPAPAPSTVLPAAPAVTTIPLEAGSYRSVTAADAGNRGTSSPWIAAVFVVIAVGSLALAALAVARTRRFRRRLEDASEPSEELRDRVAALSGRFGLARPPRVRTVAARVSPMLWPSAGGVELILPEALLERLSGGELDAVLGHELAHLKRRDHWVRLLELAATVLFWWHPALWWARFRLRRAEESSCDAWVAHALPGRARDYAEGLVKTLEFLAGAERPLPAAGTGIGRARTDMKERLTMILTERTPRLLSTWHRLAIAAAAFAVLAVLPTRADRAGEEVGDDGRSGEETWLRERALELERRGVELQRQLHELEAERRELDHRRAALQHEAELEELERTARELEAAGETAEAELHRQRREAIERENELARERYELERRLIEERIPRELELREKMLRIEELELSGKHEEAEALRAEAREGEKRLAISAMELEKRQVEIERAMAESRFAALESRRRALLDAGNDSEAARLAREMARLKAETEMMKQHHRLRTGELGHERWLLEASAKLGALEAQGHAEAAEQLRREVAARARALELERGAAQLQMTDMQASLVRAELRARLEVLESQLARASAEERERMSEEIEALEKKLAEVSEDP